MKTQKLVTSIFILLITMAAQAKYEAHEWGTFTSLVGSNGVTQNGMYHEDEELPDFVYQFGEIQGDKHLRSEALDSHFPVQFGGMRRCRDYEDKGCIPREILGRNTITQKMETPVIYFYSDRQESVSVNVKFPEGVITESFPGPVATSPRLSDQLVIAKGDTTFKVDIYPRLSPLGLQFAAEIPLVPDTNIYGHARNVASDIVSSSSNIASILPEREKFIFYRGLGRFQPKLDITSSNGDLNLYSNKRIPAAFLVHVKADGHGQLMPISLASHRRNVLTVTAQEISRLADHTTASMKENIFAGNLARAMLVKALVGEGLFVDEAEAMINTWEHGYLKVPGLRLLYILPPQEVDRILPLTLTPAPFNLTRVFVARIEVLLDTEENRIIADVLRAQDQFAVTSLGRFAEPMLRRAAEVYGQQPNPVKENINLFQTLIKRASNSNSNGVHSTHH